jgi:hypothetical protein
MSQFGLFLTKQTSKFAQAMANSVCFLILESALMAMHVQALDEELLISNHTGYA